MNTPRGSASSATARWPSCRLQDARSSIVWSLPTARAEKLLAATPEAFERELERDFDGALGKVQLASERLKFPLWRLSAERVRHRARGAGGRRRARGASARGAGRESRAC